ncbi:MAG: tetratricopeptide repeat protein [Deltaproteobacteria bacterium]|nr:tetratricopeptide repeat protein [Deltaproteobacteria bacterium]
MKPLKRQGIYLIAYCLLLLVFALSIAAFKRNLIWRDEFFLWQDTVIKSPNKSRPFNSLGVVYAKQGLYDDAIKHFKIAIKNGSGLQEVHHYNLALAYLDKGLVEDAILEFQAAVRLKPNYSDAHYRLGVVYKDTGVFEKAESAFKQAAVYAPDRDDFHTALGNIYLLQRRYNLAAEEYSRALQLNPGNVESLYNLAISYDEMKMWRDAIRYYRDFMRAAPREYQTAIENANQRQRELSKKALSTE